MAKSSAATKQTGEAGEERVNGGATPAASTPPKFARPAGYQQSAQDVEQFWTQEGPIHGKLRGFKPYINKLNKDRPGRIFVFELVEDCKTETSKGEAFEIPAKRGEIVGVWGSPGMRQLLSLQDCIVWMAPAGTKDVGKPQPMKVYDIVFKGTEKPLVAIGVTQSADSRASQDAADESDAIPF